MTTSDRPFTVTVIIPALNEEKSIGQVVASVLPGVDRVIVVDNKCTDNTAALAHAAGADIVEEHTPGYGRACLAGIAALDPQSHPDDIIVFMDGDAADDPSDLPRLIAPILGQTADFVVGSRLRGHVEQGALTLPQRFGNRLACGLLRLIWRAPFTDLGPFRAIRRSSLDLLALDAKTYGWTVQMQARAMAVGLGVTEVPVNYRNRIGTSKISGTIKGVVLAGFYILSVIAIESVRRAPSNRRLPRAQEQK